MPELPEVEVLVRYLRPLIRNKVIRGVKVRRSRVLAPTSEVELKRVLAGAKFIGLSRRGKYLCFTLRRRSSGKPILLVGHLGMTGRMYFAPRDEMLPKHAAVVLDLGRQKFVFEDTRYFGRLTLDGTALTKLGPEPLSDTFTAAYLGPALARSAQAIKVRLLDQSLVAGVGNIYASEALFRARISPRLPACDLSERQVRALCRAIREVLREAIRFGSTVPLHHGRGAKGDGLFYFGRAPGITAYYEERLRVYDREGQPCRRCGATIKRLSQTARSTFYCPWCQSRHAKRNHVRPKSN